MGIHRIYIASGIILSTIIIISAISIASNRISFRSKASVQSDLSSLSKQNSYIFASPISALADGESLIRVTVFLLNQQGLGVTGQTVKIKVMGPIKIEAIQPQTDSFGRATFDLSATNPGNYSVTAEASNVILPQTVTVSFR